MVSILGKIKTFVLCPLPLLCSLLFETVTCLLLYENDDESTASIQSNNEERWYYLTEKDQKLFVGEIDSWADVVHNIHLQGTQRKFEIISIIDAKEWKAFDEDRHMQGTVIPWDLKDTLVKVRKHTQLRTHTHTYTHIHTNKVTVIHTNSHHMCLDVHSCS